MMKASVIDHAVKLAGIFALTAGSVALARVDPNSAVEYERDTVEIFAESATDEDSPVDSAQERTLDLMLMIWILKNPSSDIE